MDDHAAKLSHQSRFTATPGHPLRLYRRVKDVRAAPAILPLPTHWLQAGSAPAANWCQLCHLYLSVWDRDREDEPAETERNALAVAGSRS
jgi:hypothetical protein